MFVNFIKSKGGKVWIIVCSILLVLTIVVNVLATTALKDMAMLVLGSPKPVYAEDSIAMYVPETMSKKDAYDNAAKTNIDVCKEGFVLLKNENEALPVEKNLKVSIFGKNSADLAYSGGGSGSFIVQEGSSLYNRLSGL